MILLLALSVASIGQYTGSNPNVALSKLVTASDSISGTGVEPGKAVDGSAATHCEIPGVAPQWIVIDLGKFYRIDGYGMDLPDPDELPLTYTFQGSTDGSVWTDLGGDTYTSDGPYAYNLTLSDPYRYVRINMTDKDVPASFGEIYVYGEELLPPVTPLAVEPSNITSTSFMANWESVSRATGYRLDVATDIGFSDYVYGFEDLDVGNVIKRQVAGQPTGTNYYYRVRAYNLAGTSSSSNRVMATTGKLAQTITFGPLAAKSYGDDDFSLTAASSSGLTVSYESSDVTVAKVSGNVVSIVGAGVTDITATQEGDATYGPATPVVQDLVVNAKNLTVSGTTADDREYDGTTDATLTVAPLAGAVTGDDVSISGSGGTFAQADPGTGIAVTPTIELSGTDAGNYSVTLPAGLTADILPKALTVTGAAVENKVYDGTNLAVISGAVIEGVIGNEVVSISGATSGTFAQSDVGTGIAVSTSITLSGADKDNYVVTQPSGLVADITAKELTVSAATAENKVYDATTDAIITGVTLVGILGSEDVTIGEGSGVFAQSGVGTGIDVTSVMTLGGTGAGNYSLVQPTGLTADITPRELTVTADNQIRDACSPNPEFTLSYSGFAGSDGVDALGTVPVASTTADGTSPAGSYSIDVSGGSADNYSFVYVAGILTVTADITAPELVIQNITIQLNEAGNATITAADLVTSATDNCGVVDTTLSKSTFGISDKGNVVVNVTVSDAAGNSTTLPAIVTVEGSTGTGDLSDIDAGIYPNPTDGVVQLEMNSGAESLKVMDMTGKSVIYISDPEPREVIDLTGYSKGVYIFQLKSGDDLKHFRVVKK